MPTISEKTGRRTEAALGCYLYAVIDSATEAPLSLNGLEGRPLQTISDGRFAMVVSSMPNAKVRPERRRLAAHHEVLRQLGQTHTVLPMTFGAIAEGPEAIRRILKLNQSAFTEQARRVTGKVEMGLRVLLDVPNIFEYLIGKHVELRALRDQVFRNGREPGQDEKIELGRLFDRVLTEEKQAQTEAVRGSLGGYCAEIKENKTRDEREVMKLACLIDGAAQKTFEEGVFAAAQQFDNNYAFDFSGPWPPHNFVEIDLQM